MGILVRVGHVLGPFGLHGLLKCEYTTDLPQLLTERKHFILADSRTSECQLLQVAEVDLKPRHFMLRFHEYTTPEQLAQFKGWDLHHVIQSSEMLREEGEVFYFELAGMEVCRPDGRVLGRICDVLETGAHTVLEVLIGNKRILIPYVKQHITDVNTAEGRLITTYPLDQHGIDL